MSEDLDFGERCDSRLRRNGVNTHGAAAKVMNLDRLGGNIRPGTFEEIKVGKRGYPKSYDICIDPNYQTT